MPNALPEITVLPGKQPFTGDSTLRERIACFTSQEIVIGVVGYAGSGTTFTIDRFKFILTEEGFTPNIVKARDIIESWAENQKYENPATIENTAARITAYQNYGDELRQKSGEYGAVAGWMVKEVHKLRHENDSVEKKHVFLLDSLKHPAEVELLRQIYGEGFRLIGVGCRPDIRQKRLERKFHAKADSPEVKLFISRDSEDSVNKHGQQVNKTFHLSDYFVDNTIASEDGKEFRLDDTLKEVFEKLFTQKISHPTRDEQGLYFADAAATSSACLSRQVGASIVDQNGNLLAVGRNDVPKAEGGLYDNDDNEEGLCYLRGECSNKVYQAQIIEDIVQIFDAEDMPNLGERSDSFRKALTKTRMGSLIEFSRSVHAEMDALISLNRTGTRLPPKSTLFTTTYPCHNCARHIVASGIQRVVYLEPYKKSLAIDLHDDAIADNLPADEVENRVSFEPYVGVAPRLYQNVYRQTGERKDDAGIALPEEKGRTLRSRLLTRSFDDLETECEEFFKEQDDETES